MSASFPTQRESVGDYNLINKTFWELNDYSRIVCECEYLLPASLIQRLVFHLWWNLRFLPKLYMTSEEEGRAKPSLSTNFTENHIIRLSPSLHGLPSTVLLADSVCLCHSRDSGPAFWEEENGEHEPAEETQLRHQAGSYLHLLVRRRLNPLTEVRHSVTFDIRFFIKFMWKVFVLLKTYSYGWNFHFSIHLRYIGVLWTCMQLLETM